MLPNFSFEEPLWNEKYTVIGIDEVGRGAFAGPVGIGGVVFPPSISESEKQKLLSLGINDSKKLSPKKREYLSEIIKEECLSYNISFINVETINRIGIGKATYMGMQQVTKSINYKLRTTNLYLLIDAFEIPGLNLPQKGIIRGDSLSISIAAASIIAKVERDRLMEQLSAKFPNYGFEKHKGYGTQFHRNEIKKHGMTKQHRVVFCEKSL